MSIINKIFKLPVIVHLLAIAVTSCIAVYILLKSIDAYTNHNQAVNVPDVRNLQVEDAVPFFELNKLRYNIIDSIYSKDVAPGAIIELMPEANSKVKKNRVISITVNAKTEETATIPSVEGISYRQAYAQLKARGFANVEKKFVTGEYYDLTVGVEYGGFMADSGMRAPLSADLVLVVSDGYTIVSDSISVDSTGMVIDESWFIP
jgi:Uncharacterized protein conserved in bacteria